jgi:Lrp/AsnC family leucine-responsive transcriptional regulator
MSAIMITFKIVVKDMEAYRNFGYKLTTLQHIGSTHSTFMISEVKHYNVD